MIWMLLRSVKMKGFMRGFHLRVRCPKWTPVSNSAFMLMTAIDRPSSIGCFGRLPPSRSQDLRRAESLPPGRERSAVYHALMGPSKRGSAGNPGAAAGPGNGRASAVGGLDGHRSSDLMLVGVAQADGPALQAHRMRQPLGLSVQAQQGPPPGAVDDFDLFPADVADPGSHGLGDGLLGGEAGCQRGRVAFGVDQLLGGVEPVEEALAMPQDGLVDALHLDDVHARMDHGQAPGGSG